MLYHILDYQTYLSRYCVWNGGAVHPTYSHLKPPLGRIPFVRGGRIGRSESISIRSETGEGSVPRVRELAWLLAEIGVRTSLGPRPCVPEYWRGPNLEGGDILLVVCPGAKGSRGDGPL